MSVVAVDIVILPQEPVKSLAINLSRQINQGAFYLNRTNLLPHITLAMGFTDGLDFLEDRLKKIAGQLRPFEAEVEKIDRRYLMIKRIQPLVRIHKHIIARTPINIDPWKKDKQSAYFRKKGEVISQKTVNYTKNFLFKNSDENWVPHITFGWDDEADTSKLKADLPLKFKVDEVAVCQLGEKNTCRKVLSRWKLFSN